MKVNELLNETAERAIQQVKTGEVELETAVHELVNRVWDQAVRRSAAAVEYFERTGDLEVEKQHAVRQCKELIKELVGEQAKYRYDERL